MNSLEKTSQGDYLISARHTNTIYLISRRDGAIIWRLGGSLSSFKLDGFNFSGQHDARILPSEDSNTTIVSFVNNASNQYEQTAAESSGMIVSLDHNTRVASLVLRIPRPDGGMTTRRGNVQRLPNGHYFVCWSEFGYISEHDSSGRLLVEARLRDDGLASYRAFQLNSPAPWSLPQSEQPVMKVFRQARDESLRPAARRSIIAYISWNGATTVAYWKVYACIARWPRMPLYNPKESNTQCKSESILLAEAVKAGFETTIEIPADRNIKTVYAEAMNFTDQTIGITDIAVVEDADVLERITEKEDDAYEVPVLYPSRPRRILSQAWRNFISWSIVFAMFLLTITIWSSVVHCWERRRRTRYSYSKLEAL
jgi:hypothetical protein